MATNLLAVGDKAPAITLVDQHGDKRTLKEFGGRKVLVFFYPKADTPGCTTQACGLRDIADGVGDTQIIGISPDTPDKQGRFDEKYDLGYPLLADVDHKVAEKYGAWREKNMYGKKSMGIARSTFIIDADGRVATVFKAVKVDGHADQVLAALGESRP